MSKSYYDPSDLRKFGNITEWNEELGGKFFDYYGKVFGLQRGITKEEMMEAVHAGAAIESGATLVHSVQMMNKYEKLSM